MKKIINKVAMLLLVITMLVPSGNIFAATKYFSVERTDKYAAFQEDAVNQIETNDVSFKANGAYKFVIEKDDGFVGMNDSTVYNSAEDALKDMMINKKGDTVFFNLFTKEYTPKEYTNMLANATIHVYDAGNNVVDSFPLLKYQDYISYGKEAKEVSVKVNKYIGDNKIKEGADLTIFWDLGKEKPQELIISNDAVNYYKSFDISGKDTKDTLDMALDFMFNGTYKFTVVTIEDSYEQLITFDKFADYKAVKPDSKENNEYTEKTDKVDSSNVKITVDGIPSRKIEDGNSFTLIVTTNVKSNVNMNGRVDSTYQKKHKFNITENGTYTINAYSEAGKSAKKTIKVNCFKAAPAVADKTYSRGNMWPGLPENRLTESETLAQTGMYDSTILVVGILVIFTALLLGAQLIAEERKKKSGR